MMIDRRLENESLFVQAFHHAPIGMAIISADARMLKVNGSACTMLGYSEAELTGLKFPEITHPDDLPYNLQMMQQCLEGKFDSYRLEKRFFRKDGHTVWVQLSESLVRDETGAAAFLISQFLDITERVDREQHWQETEQRYQSLFHHHPDLIFSVDLEGDFTTVNGSFATTMGYSQEHIRQNKLNFRALVDPADLERIERHFYQTVQGTPQCFETAAAGKNGNSAIFDVTSIPIFVNEQVVGVYGIAREITGQKELWRKLEETEMQYRLISENAQDLITFATPDGITRYVSPAVKPLLGYEPEEVIGAVVTYFWHPYDVINVYKSGILQDSDVDIFNCRVRHKEGYYLWIETKVKLIRNEAGQVVHVLGVGREITERKQAEEELKKTKDRLESVIRNNADAMWVTDLEDTVVEVNAAFERMFQWTTDEIVGRQLPLVPDMLKDVVQDIHREVKAGQSVVGYETIRRRKDGSLLEVSASLSPVRDGQGNIIGITGICRDISERKQAEKELKTMKDQLDSFIDNNIDPIIMLNNEERVVRVNRAFELTFGWSAAEMVGRNAYEMDYVPRDRRAELIRNVERMKANRPVEGYETVRLRKDGLGIPVMLSSLIMCDEHENVNGWAVIIRDITAQKQAEQLMIHSEKLSIAGQLAAGIAHEIRNPITAVKGFVQLMRTGQAEKKMYFDIMASEIERIEMILSELLVLAKPQVVQFERRDVRTLLAQVTALLDTQAILNDVQIVTQFEPGCTDILCDENQLKQVCINFIKNGIEAMPNGGKMLIQSKKKNDDTLLLCFIDQGTGIPAHILERLGQPFYTTKEKGTGLGFMVSKRIIENHCGDVRVFSKENEGTTIEVTLPLSPQNAKSC